MYFKQVKLENFRNYKEQTVIFDKKLNLILGQNAQGKTNLLESLFIMSLGRSFRTNRDQEMIAFGKNFSKVTCVVADDDDDNEENEICVIYRPEGKIIKLNGVKLQRSVDLLENVYIVVFSPDDLKIVKEGPENRRRFLDRELCQIKPVYYSDLGNYKKVLQQRNMLLREKNTDRNLMAVFDETLADYGIKISDERCRFAGRVQDISREIHSRISDGKESLEIKYEYSVETGPEGSFAARKEEYKKKLKESFEKDILRGYTGLGPHKDDLAISINGKDIRSFGSQGQQRTAALSMKLAEIALIKQETGKNAVLLLDDVLSELDRSRQRFLIESMRDVQLFISAASVEDELMKLLPAGNIYEITDGCVNILT